MTNLTHISFILQYVY